MESIIKIFKILSDETRLRILLLLYHRKLCVCQIQGILDEPQPKISKHLGKLRDMGLVQDERKEQFIFYYLRKDNRTLESILKDIIENIEQYPLLEKDLLEITTADKYIEAKK